jgi:hypothetical protein
MHRYVTLLFSLLLAFGATGCPQYYTVDEACDPGFSGKGQMTAEGVEAFDRMNCYRRISGVSKGTGSAVVVEAADNEMNYILQNPDPTLLLGSEGVGGYLTQDPTREGFTGISVRERLEDVNYAFFDPINTLADEVIGIHYKKAGEPDYTTERAVDELMRLTRMRQSLQQPSWLDGGYAQLTVDKEWLTAAGAPAAAESATIYYFIIIFTAPHLEHAATPVMLPKEDQTEVPLYANAIDYTEIYEPVPTRLSWPITFLVGTLDQDNYHAVDQNPYEVDVGVAELTDTSTNQPLDTHVVLPGDEIDGPYPDGNRQRWIVGIYARDPFTPLTKYKVHAELTTVDGDYTIDYAFTTMAAEADPGFTEGTPVISPTTTGETARAIPQPFVASMRSTPALAPQPLVP